MLYLVIGLVGAGFSLLLIGLPRTPAMFGAALLGENIFQAAAFAVSNVISLNTLGADNPLAATQFGLLFASSAVPLTYMQIIDGAAFTAHGLNGGFFRRRGPDRRRLHRAGAGASRLPRRHGPGRDGGVIVAVRRAARFQPRGRSD
ncbi:MAG: hypothetical protein WDM85_05330 [Caulobacteraceae bacterium]